jgi:antitoxin VapB
MKQVAVFNSKCGQTVRLSKSVALPDNVTHVDIVVVGRTRILIPTSEAWSSWFDESGLSSDFERYQTAAQDRHVF